jgi:hypothetical protein
MEKQEFFLLLPAIVYGVAVVDLLKVFRHKKSYWEMIAWGLVLMVYIVIIWLELWTKLDVVATDKWFFILTIVSAVILAQTSSLLTPEEKDTDTEKYFLLIRRRFFLLLILIVGVNLALQELFYDDQRPLIFRITFITLFVLCALVDKVWVRAMSFAVVMFFLISVIVKL